MKERPIDVPKALEAMAQAVELLRASGKDPKGLGFACDLLLAQIRALQGGRAKPVVVVVDDNRDWADTLATLLRTEGYVVHTAYDGGEALELVPRVKPDAVLLDIGLPKMSGYEVARQLRKRPGTPVLVAVTAWTQESDRILARQAGFDHHFSKPVETRKLIELLAGSTKH
jgi:CheY-like chemotaxis protein